MSAMLLGHAIIRRCLAASTKNNRKDFGIIGNTALDFGGVLVGDEVTIALDVQCIKS